MGKTGTPRVAHMGATKGFIIGAIKRWGVADVLPDHGHLSEDEAIALIESDPRSIFCSCDCPKAEDGSCGGWAS
jgi:hypothetical protein